MNRVLTLLIVIAFGCMLAGCAELQPSLKEFTARLPVLQGQIPALSDSAEQSADEILDHPKALLGMPYGSQASFSEELISRAGGLCLAYSNEVNVQDQTPQDIALVSVRSWEKEAAQVVKRVRDYKDKGWVVTVFGSTAGCPKELAADFFIDNGAPSGAAVHGRINLLANVTLGWMWCCEYAAAMSRRGKFPGILYSVAMPGGEEFDKPLQTIEGRHTVVSCDKALDAGMLAGLYLKRVQQLVADCSSPRTQEQLAKAADVITAHVKAGERVGVSGMGHVILAEVSQDTKVPWNAFQAAGASKTAFKEHMQPGELLVWVGYVGMNSAYENCAKAMDEAGLQIVSCYAPDPTWAANPPFVLAHIDQRWALPDAEVPIPVPPYKMAPVSGVNAGLIFRMIDDEVAARLAKK